jgi:Spy/CpxP family protein refolding chaperone
MNTLPLRASAFALALLAIGVSLSAQGPGPSFGPGSANKGRGFRGLNLTEAQQAQVKAIHERHQAAFTAKGEVAGAAHKALREAMQNLATDTNTLKALHEKATGAQFDLMLEHRATRQEILPLLTAEQKVLFEKHGLGMGPQEGRGMGHGMGHGMGRRPGGMGPDGARVRPS